MKLLPTQLKTNKNKNNPGEVNVPAVQETQELWVWSLGQEDHLQKGMATYSSILDWNIHVYLTGKFMDRGAWRAAVHGATKSPTWLRTITIIVSCNHMDCSLPGSSVHGILQARILEWIAIPFLRGSSQLRNCTSVFCIAGRFFTVWDTREAQIMSWI